MVLLFIHETFHELSRTFHELSRRTLGISTGIFGNSLPKHPVSWESDSQMGEERGKRGETFFPYTATVLIYVYLISCAW